MLSANRRDRWFSEISRVFILSVLTKCLIRSLSDNSGWLRTSLVNLVPSFDSRNWHCLTRLIGIISHATMELKTWELSVERCILVMADSVQGREVAAKTWMASLGLGEGCYFMYDRSAVIIAPMVLSHAWELGEHSSLLYYMMRGDLANYGRHWCDRVRRKQHKLCGSVWQEQR